MLRWYMGVSVRYHSCLAIGGSRFQSQHQFKKKEKKSLRVEGWRDGSVDPVDPAWQLTTVTPVPGI